MSEKNIFKKIKRFLKAGRRTSPPALSSRHLSSQLGKFLRMVFETDEVEISCNEVFEMLDRYVELEARGEDVAHLFPPLMKHLERCKDCREEYEALRRIMQASPA